VERGIGRIGGGGGKRGWVLTLQTTMFTDKREAHATPNGIPNAYTLNGFSKK
jgi:hypothetical protein